MSMSLSSASINDLAGASIDNLAGSTLTAGSSEPENPDNPVVSTECPWTSSLISSLQDSIAELKTLIQSLQSDVTTIKNKTNKIPNSPAAVGSAMTLTSTYDAAKTAAPTLQQIWGYSSRTLTESPTNISSLATATDVSGAISTLESYGDSKWSTATGFLTSSDISSLATQSDISSLSNAISNVGGLTSDQATQLAKIFALLANWSVSGTTLTATLGSNSTCSFTLTKNSDGEITGVSPATT